MTPASLSQLGLDPHANERAVKRAYAALLKSRRPDDDPAQFQRLNEVYQDALEYVRRCAKSATAIPTINDQDATAKVARAQKDPADSEDDRIAPHPWNSDPTAAAREAEPTFDANAFFAGLLNMGSEPSADLESWLQSQPALYSLRLRSRLVPALIHTLELLDRLPTPDNLAVLLEFFGLDRIDRRNLPLQDRLERLKDLAHQQHHVIVGPDMSFLLQSNRVRGRPKIEWLWVWLAIAVLSGIVILTVLSRPSSEDRGTTSTPKATTSPKEFVDPREDPPPWRYDLPEETPVAPENYPD